MLYAQKFQAPKFAYFSDSSNIHIKSHRTQGGVTSFYYEIPIIIDKSQIKKLTGSLFVSIFSSKKTKSPIRLNRSDVLSGNVLKKIDRQKFLQSKENRNLKKIISKTAIDAPDLNLDLIKFEIVVTSAQVFENFFIEITNQKPDGSQSVIDSTTINHSYFLKKYDLPGQEFSLTVSRRGNKQICASAATDDSKVGSFSFFVRNDSRNIFEKNNFLKPVSAKVESSGLASVVFEVSDNQSPITIRACPISIFENQTLGNFKEVKDDFDYEDKYIPFYVSSLDDTKVSFTFAGIGSDVRKILLFRQGYADSFREFVKSINIVETTVIEDVQRNPQYDYTYTVDYIDASGILRSCPNEVIVLALKLDKLAKINVKISQENTESSELTSMASGEDRIRFNAKVEYNTQTLFDEILSDVKDLGLESILSEDLKKMTNNIKPLTRVIATKISLTTGREEHLGIFKPGIIEVPRNSSDSEIFRFEVAVRSVPESLESLAAAQRLLSDNAYNLKSISDLSTKIIGNRARNSQKNFSSKFYTKSSIRNSTLTYGDTATLADIGYFSGRTGIFADVKIPKINQSDMKKITNIQIIKNELGFYAKWNFSGNIANMDYFEITADKNVYISHPSPSPSQLFFLGNKKPQNIEIRPVSLNEKIYSKSKMGDS